MNIQNIKPNEPNIPSNYVAGVFISDNFPLYMEEKLHNFNIQTIRLKSCKNILSEVRYHTDILCCNVKKGIWFFEPENAFRVVNDLDTFWQGSDVVQIIVGSELKDKYPHEVMYNCFTINEHLFCSGFTSPHILKYAEENELNIIKVKQGYTKCSAAICGKNSIVTSDKGLYKILIELKYNALLINGSDIRLNGFSCGFIGGCSGMIAADKIAFTGNLTRMKDYKSLKSFLDNIHIESILLGNEVLYDYGGILPFCEYSV
ncbi:MAG: hypothetical protein A2Y17_02845 [Clostridiales bacterium GWF2_38_85]|nr:MAG: hypothetical protein A2Y17_02845 [Clostridiales bacterium GWF2_38_85]